MTSTRSFKQRISRVYRHWQDDQIDAAVAEVEGLLETWPGNAQAHVLWASLVQLQEKPSQGLDEVKKALENAVALDKNSPESPIELGHYLDSVEDNPQAAARAFSEGIASARKLLIDGLLGKARALLQLGKRDAAFKCLMESLHLSSLDSSIEAGEAAVAPSDILLREPAGQLMVFQLKGPFAVKIEDLLEEFYPKRSA